MTMRKNSYSKKIDRGNTIIGSNLKKYREKLNLSQTEIAKLLDVSYQQVQKYESGTNRISAVSLYILSEHYNIDIELFFKGMK